MARARDCLAVLICTACAPGPPHLAPVAPCPALVRQPATVADSTIYDSSRVTRLPRFASVPVLAYPASLYDARIDGRVLVQVIIGADGRAEPRSMIVLSSTNTLFEQDAKAYVRDATYCPAVIGDRPVRAWAIIPIVFDSRASVQ